MAKRVFSVLASLVLWFAVVAAAAVPFRAFWPAYVAASPDFAFTLAMKIARLSVGALATLVAGAAAAYIARSTRMALVTGALLLLIFIPEHVSLWDKFPIWYHLTFLASLVPLAFAGGWMIPDHPTRT